MKQKIRLTESDLHRIVRETVKRLLKEDELPYLSDKKIHKQYEGYEIDDFYIKPIQFRYSNDFGWECGFEISFPNVDHPDFDDSRWVNVDVDDEKGERIGFDVWFPNDIRDELLSMIRSEIKKHWSEMVVFKEETIAEEQRKKKEMEELFRKYCLEKRKK